MYAWLLRMHFTKQTQAPCTLACMCSHSNAALATPGAHLCASPGDVVCQRPLGGQHCTATQRSRPCSGRKLSSPAIRNLGPKPAGLPAGLHDAFPLHKHMAVPATTTSAHHQPTISPPPTSNQHGDDHMVLGWLSRCFPNPSSDASSPHSQASMASSMPAGVPASAWAACRPPAGCGCTAAGSISG